MFSNFKFLFYVNSIQGLAPFSYKIVNKEITFSFSRVKTIYSYVFFVSLAIYSVVSICLECYVTISSSFLSLVTSSSALVLWLCCYFTNFYYAKKLTLILKMIFDLEQLKQPERRNILFHIYCWFWFILLLSFFIQNILSYFKYIIWEFSLNCVLLSWTEMLVHCFFELQLLLILTELQNLIKEWTSSLNSEKNLKRDAVEKYINVLLQMKEIFKEINCVYQLMVTVLIGLNFMDMLMSFNSFLAGGNIISYNSKSTDKNLTLNFRHNDNVCKLHWRISRSCCIHLGHRWL